MTRAALAGRVLEPGLCGSRLHGGYTAGDVVNRSCNRHATQDAAAWGLASPGKPGRASPDQARQSCWARSASMGGGKQPMSQQSSGPAGPGRGDWPDDLWPDENDDGANEGTRPAPSMPAGRPGDGPARSPLRSPRGPYHRCCHRRLRRRLPHRPLRTSCPVPLVHRAHRARPGRPPQHPPSWDTTRSL